MRGHSTVGWLVGVMTVLSAVSVGAQRWGRPSVPRDGACFYRDQNYGGEYFCTDAGRDIASMPRDMNDQITSIRTFGNVQVTLYRDAMFRGRSVDLKGDVRNVGNDWNDRISSVRVRRSVGRDRDRDGDNDRGRDNDRNGDRGRDRNSRWTDQQAEAMVARAYRTLLGRDPDPSSRSWVNQVQSNNWTEEQLADAIKRSSEYIDKHPRERR